jgi:hypothetical protein
VQTCACRSPARFPARRHMRPELEHDSLHCVALWRMAARRRARRVTPCALHVARLCVFLSHDLQSLHATDWVGAEERYQQEFNQSVKDLSGSKSMTWLSQGTGVFGTIHRPVPDQPWRPMRMRITGTGTMLPEVQVDVASRDKLGQSMSVSAAAGMSVFVSCFGLVTLTWEGMWSPWYFFLSRVQVT